MANAARRAAFSYPLALVLLGCQPAGTAVDEAVPEPGPPRSIGDVQGSGLRSPHEGRVVTVQGVVTGNFVQGLGGFFMQDPSGAEDGNPATSDGLFVVWDRNARPRVRRGERVQVRGKVVELGQGAKTLTALAEAKLEVLGRAAVAATVLDRPPARAADWEALEGMWLRLPGPLVISGNRELLRFGVLQLAFGERLRAPTDVAAPGAKAEAVLEDNRRRGLVLDDGRDAVFPGSFRFLGEPPSDAQPVRAGSRVWGIEGILDHRHGEWRLQSTERIGRIEALPRPAPPVLPQGLRLASINLLNLFNGNGRGRGFPTARGASSLQEYRRQRDKHVAVLMALQPDIVAFSEVENDGEGRGTALADLVDALNRALGEDGDYLAVAGTGGNQPIRVALAWRSRRVQPEGPAVELLEGPFRSGHRPPLARTFVDLASGRRLTVVANHLKSKGDCPEEADSPDRDRGDGQGCWNASRVEAVRALDLWLKSDPTGAGTAHRILLGDFNSYTREDPLRLLRSLGWRDAVPVRDASHRHHSFVYRGLAGALDHALLSPGLVATVLAAQSWAINSDESEWFDYNLERRPPTVYRPLPFAASDHDPLIVVLDLRRAAQ